MKALRRHLGTRHSGPQAEFTISRSVFVLSLLLLLLMALVVGCDVVQDLTSTTAPSGGAASTSTTLATATTLAATTTTAQAEPATTTSAVDSTTTSTATASTTTSTTVVSSPGTASAGTQQAAGTVLYEIADWSLGTSGWAAAGQWRAVSGMLVTDGTSDSVAVAPVDLTGYPDYVVECELQILDPTQTDVLLVARMINGEGYWAGFDGSATHMVVGYGTGEMVSSGFVLDNNWHKYRLEVRGNSIKLFFEQAEVARAVDNRALQPGTVGIYCAHGQINVRSFKVITL